MKIERNYTLHINGKDHPVESDWLGENLLYVLREKLGMWGTKNACEQGECGSCSVFIDGVMTCSCMELSASAVGTEITTVEGLAPHGELTDVQEEMLNAGAVQCGFCTPGLVVAVTDLLETNSTPSRLEVKEALAGNLCRCTGYGRIEDAVFRISEKRARKQ